MNQESSSSLALTGLNVVIEDESDYVFVAGDLDVQSELEPLQWEDEEFSYDHCDLSPVLSCATSVATNVTLKDSNLVEDDAAAAATTDAAGRRAESRDDGGGNFETTSDRDADARTAFPFVANPKNGRRLSNKKLRKKIKMMKKIAAARAAAEALTAMSSSTASESDEGGPSSPVRTTSSRSKLSSPKRKSGQVRSGNIAVACAQESLAAYREEIEAGKAAKKQASRINYVC